MKKIVCLVLITVLCFAAIPALAAGRLNVLQENYHYIGGYMNYVYAFAKVENSGDRPIKVNAGVFEIYDADGEVLTSTDYKNSYATYLQPGEYTYVKMYEDVQADQVPDDYMMTLTGKSDKSKVAFRVPVEASFELGVKEGYWEYNYLYAKVTNPTQDILYNVEVVFALTDADGNLIYIESKSLYDEIGILPGESLMIRQHISTTFMDYFKAQGIVPANVDALVYVMQDGE